MPAQRRRRSAPLVLAASVLAIVADQLRFTLEDLPESLVRELELQCRRCNFAAAVLQRCRHRACSPSSCCHCLGLTYLEVRDA